MRRVPIALAASLLAVACTSRDVGPYAPDAQDKANERLAAQNSFCAIENQARCDHLIENRTLLSRFYTPETFGGMDEGEKFRGRSVTTKFVVEAAAAIKQCNRVDATSIVIIKGLEIAGSKYEVKGTSPLVPQGSTCFISPQLEDS